MRRVFSVVLLVFGGWMLLTEAVGAFFDVDPGLGDNAAVIGIFALISLIPLMLGAWASPGRRWRELGLTILIAIGMAAFCGLATMAVFLDPGFKPYLPPMPKFEFTPVLGVVNAVVIGALGALLYRSGKADPGSSPG